jgi:hypothetical protein
VGAAVAVGVAVPVGVAVTVAVDVPVTVGVVVATGVRVGVDVARTCLASDGVLTPWPIARETNIVTTKKANLRTKVSRIHNQVEFFSGSSAGDTELTGRLRRWQGTDIVGAAPFVDRAVLFNHGLACRHAQFGADPDLDVTA